MEPSDTFVIARQGWKYIGASAALFIVSVLLHWDFMQFAGLVGVLLFGYLFRNPERIVPYYQDHSIVAVADGRVRSIETVEQCPFLEGPCYRVEIVSGIFNIALLRMPFEGVISKKELRRGSRLSALSPLAAKLNERAVLEFQSAAGHRCCVMHQLDRSVDALSVDAGVEQKLHQGGRYGLMLRGTHQLYLPLQSRVALKVGDEVRAGESLVGYFS